MKRERESTGLHVSSVERCNMEQHLSVCPLELVACEMKEFGCSVVVPRKELARHMRESELQHLTAMTVMNLRLTRQQDSTERDRKIAQLQQEMTDQKKLLIEMAIKIDQQKKELAELRDHIQHTTKGIETDGAGSGCEVFTFTQYSKWKDSGGAMDSDPFYSHRHGYKFKLRIRPKRGTIGAFLYLIKGEYDDELAWPTKVKVKLELLNQAEDHHHHVMGTVVRQFTNNTHRDFADKIQRYKELYVYPGLKEMLCGDVQYMMNDCLKFRIHITFDRFHHTEDEVSEPQTITFTQYSKKKGSGTKVYSDPFYLGHRGYKFILGLKYNGLPEKAISAFLTLMKGEYDNKLCWPVKVEVELKLLNQAGDHHHVERTNQKTWRKRDRDTEVQLDAQAPLGSVYDLEDDEIPTYSRSHLEDDDIPTSSDLESQCEAQPLLTYPDLERHCGVQYVMNDSLKFRLHTTTL